MKCGFEKIWYFDILNDLKMEFWKDMIFWYYNDLKRRSERYDILKWFTLYFDKDLGWNDILFWSIKYCFKVITMGYNNDWLLKRPGSDIVL